MTSRRPLVPLLAASVLFSACSSSTTVPSAAAAATLHFVNGSHYAYREVVNVPVVPPPGGSPAPLPSPLGDSVTLSTNASFNGSSGLIDVVSQRSSGANLASHDYFAETPATGGTYVEHVGSAGTSSTLVYTSPAVTLELPFRAGNRWDSSASFTSSSKLGEETWNRDGTYASDFRFKAKLGKALKVIRIQEVVEADGSGTLVQTDGHCVPLTVMVGRPVRSGGRYAIPVEMYRASTCSGPVQVQKGFSPDWYPGGGLPPSPLSQSTTTDEGVAAIPSDCNVAPSVATRAEKLVLSASDLNPLGGFTSTTHAQYYAQPLGLVCDEVKLTVESVGVGIGAVLIAKYGVFETLSMRSFSHGAGAVLEGAAADQYVGWIAAFTACSNSQLIGRNTWAAGSSIPALCRS